VLNEELDKFKDKVGHFGKPVAKAGCNDYDFNPGISDPQFLFSCAVVQISK
jgi:hypothetical protein